MAKSKRIGIKGATSLSTGSDESLYQCEASGLIHSADSLAPTRTGQFIRQFGPPDDPEIAPSYESAGELVSRVGHLGTRWMQGNGGTISASRKKKG